MHRFLVPCLLAAMTTVSFAQQRANDTVLRGPLPSDESPILPDEADGDEASEDDPFDFDNEKPRRGTTRADTASARPVGRVEPVAPVTTGSLGRYVPAEDEGFEGEANGAAGIRVGTFLLYPELIVRGGATTNVEGTRGGTSGTLYRIAPSVRVTTDWDRHYSETTLRGTYLGYPEQSEDPEISMDAENRTRIDAGDATTLESRAAYALAPESGSSPENAGTAKTVYQHGIGGSLAVTHDAGVIAATLKGALDGSLYTGATSGARDNLVASATLRLGYDVRAMVSPFAEATVLRRVYEGTTGRDALGYALRGGLAFDGGPKLRGELGVGWRTEDLEGRQYKDLQGLLVDADLTWSPTRLTTVRVSASTAFEASSLAGTSGSIVYAGEAAIAHSLTRDLSLELAGGAAYRTYQGLPLDELTLTGSATASYAVTDTAAVQAQYSYERVDSSRVGQDYDSHAIEAGIRLRR